MDNYSIICRLEKPLVQIYRYSSEEGRMVYRIQNQDYNLAVKTFQQQGIIIIKTVRTFTSIVKALSGLKYAKGTIRFTFPIKDQKVKGEGGGEGGVRCSFTYPVQEESTAWP